MQVPKFATAIPKRRYRLGEFTVTVLGEVESTDGNPYVYLMAFVPDGRTEPLLYLTCEQRRAEGEGAYGLRLYAPTGMRLLGTGDRWGDLDAFVEDALDVGRKMLALTDEEARQFV